MDNETIINEFRETKKQLRSMKKAFDEFMADDAETKLEIQRLKKIG